jgi:hypothetical protein
LVANKSAILVINIANIAVALETQDDQVAERIRDRYAAFLEQTAPPRFIIRLTIIPGALFMQPEPGPWVIESSYSQEQLIYRSYTERGQIHLQSGEGWLEMAPTAHVENFLRVAYAWLCLQNGGLLLHAAGAIRNGQGFVFFGPSGAGKTTTSRLAARTADVVSDDLVIIRCDNGGCTLHGVPFKGELSDAPRANQSAPLAGLYRLRQDTGHYLEAIPRMQAVAELAAASPFVVREPALSDRLLEVCNRIAKTVPVQQLHFRRDDGFWKVIDGREQSLPETASADGR